MTVWLKDKNKRWTKGVPYVFDNSGFTQKFKEADFLALIEAFNQQVGKRIFFPRKDESDYLELKYDSQYANSCLGRDKQGKNQLQCGEKNMFHEFGHCVGLGHQHYYKNWPILEYLGDLNLLDFKSQVIFRDKYATDNNYRNDSVMCYPLTSFLFSPDILGAVSDVNYDHNPTQKPQSPFPPTKNLDPKVRKLIRGYMRHANSDDMTLNADDIARIKWLCPDAADV